MPFIGLLTTDNSILLQTENTIFNTKVYVQLLKDDIYFFNKIQKSKKLQLQYFINVYFWTFKWLNQNQSDFINDIVTTNEELVSKYTENLNAFYISIFKNKPYIEVANLNVAANQFFTNRPSFLIFNWVTILGGLYYSGGIVTSGITNWKLYKKPVLDFLTKNVWQSVLWEPIIKIFKTLNDYDSKDLSIVASDYTLSNEKTSLKEQYQTFLANNHTQKISQEKNYNDDELEKNFLHLYNEITNKPWSSLVKGDLITVLLITLQRVKLEANVSLSSIDKLIQSQNLLIKIIGITPAILILYSTYKFVIKPIIYDAPLSIFSNLINFIKGQVYILNNSNKNINLEYKLLYCKLINNDKTDVSGNYFVSLDDLYELGLKQIPTELHLCWNEQIKRLLNTNDSKDHMIEIMTLDSAYSIYFTQ
ncbi:hypothetical protein ACO0SA_000789 [Hanseniaspora valbyensis]